MKDIRIHFDGKDGTVFDFRSVVEDKALFQQKAVLNIATEQGSDPLYAGRGTTLLADSINGLTINRIAAQHSGNFAALDTLLFLAPFYPEGVQEADRIAELAIVPTDYDINTNTLRFDTVFTFSDDTIVSSNTTLNA